MQNYRESASKLNKALQRAAETAAAQAEHFRACIKDSNLDNEIEMAGRIHSRRRRRHKRR